MKIRELTEAPMSYGQEGKPEWYDRAVQMKLNNPRITAKEIARQIGKSPKSVMYWLTGYESPGHRFSRKPRPSDSFPFKPEDFPQVGNLKYTDGTKPEWYDQALQMAKAGESFTSIGKKLGLARTTISQWLVKGRKGNTGRLINPDAELEPRIIRGQKLDINLINSFIQDDYTDKEIIELIKDEKGPKIASQVRDMLPVLRQKLNPGTQVIDKTASGLNNPIARPPKVIA